MEESEKSVTFRAVISDEEGLKKVEKAEMCTHNLHTLRYIEKKQVDKGVQRMERDPVYRIGGLGRPAPKRGHGGKYTWEGPRDLVGTKLSAPPPAMDERDPNYVGDEEEQEQKSRDVSESDEGETEGVVVGLVEVAKVAEAKEGVSRIEIDPPLAP